MTGTAMCGGVWVHAQTVYIASSVLPRLAAWRPTVICCTDDGSTSGLVSVRRPLPVGCGGVGGGGRPWFYTGLAGPRRSAPKIDGIVFRASSAIMWSIDPCAHCLVVPATATNLDGCGCCSGPGTSASLAALFICARTSGTITSAAD